MTTPRSIPLTRRRALAGATGVGVALPVLAACGDDGGATTAESSSPSPSGGPASSSATTGAEPTTDAPSSEAAASGVVSTADVPVGGGVILADDEVVVTQPTEGEIKVFSSICTHSGCPVTEVTETIDCRCHGSMFDLTTGDVVAGPAPSPLPAVDFSVEGDQVVLA